MAFHVSYVSRVIVPRRTDSTVGTFENEQHTRAIVVVHCSEMEGRGLMGRPCINRSSCFHKQAADLSVTIECSEMEGRLLIRILGIHI
jgi:hypothetical protein